MRRADDSTGASCSTPQGIRGNLVKTSKLKGWFTLATEATEAES